MAEKILDTRIQLKYDLYDSWKTNNPVLKKGEVAIVEVPVEAKEGENNVVPQQPVILFKVGDGSKSFNLLDWSSSKAADVYDWAKAPTRPTYAARDITGIDAYIAQYVNEQMGISVDTDTQYTIEKVSGDDYKYQLKSKSKADTAFSTVVADIVIPKYDDTAISGKITELKNLVGSTAVHEQIVTAIETLALDDTYANRQDFEDVKRTVDTINGDHTTEGSFRNAIVKERGEIDLVLDDHTDRIEKLEADVGDLENLETTNKDDLIGAINEVRNSVSAGGTAAAITITTNTTTEGALKSYTIKQGENTVGVIDIPKDMVVVDGEVVVFDEEWMDEGNGMYCEPGTYIRLDFANVEHPLYIEVGSLVDIYHAKENAAQVQIAIDVATREISATIVAGSIGATELANNAVTTVKIANGNVTKEKLSTAVQGSLDKADSAIQTVAEGSANGTIKVDGTDVNVHGLGSAAFKNEDHFATKAEFKDVSGIVGNLQDKAHEHANSDILAGITQDKINTWDSTEQRACKYADDLLQGLDSSVSATAADGNKISVLTGVTQQDGKFTGKTEVKLEAVAKTGNVNDLIQTDGDVLVFYCGTSSEVI